MFQLCVTEPVLTSVTRPIVVLAARSTRKVLPMSMNCGALAIEGRGASAPAAVNR